MRHESGESYFHSRYVAHLGGPCIRVHHAIVLSYLMCSLDTPGAGEGRRLSADTVAEGLRGLGLELDKEQVNAIRRLGAPQAMKSLVELGNYFQSTKNKKGDNNCYGFSKSLSSVAAPTSQGHSSTGAGDSMLVKDEQCEASSPSSSSQVGIVSNCPRMDLDSIAGFIAYNSPDHHDFCNIMAESGGIGR